MTEDAQSQFGNPDPGTELRGEWNQTKNAIIDNLATASIMPYMLDETRNAKDTTALSEVPFMVRAGIETGRANLQGRARKLKTFHLNLFSTGESRLSSATGVTGVRRRVIEPAAPLAEQEDADFIHGVAERFYGWPLKWKVEMGPVSEVELEVPVFENKLMNDLARPLAAAALGFQKLCESVDVECTVDYMEVYRELGETLEDEGRAWKRLYDLLVEDRISQNGEYGKSGRYGRNGKDSLYMATDKSAEFLGEYSWAVFPERVKWLAEKIDLSDPTVALKGMKEQGLLSTYEGDSKLTQRVPTGNGNRTRMYVFVVREEDLDGWTNASESVDKLVDSE